MRLNTERYVWCIGALVKFALLGAPAVVTLCLWRRLGPERRTLYHVSWTNISVFLVWLAAMSFISIMSGSQAYRDWVAFSGLPAALAFFIPFLSAVGSVILCLLGLVAKPEERLYPLASNMLMLILWIVSVVAPN